jgi:transcriptional regulator with XRE-family HTH domain
MKASSKSIQPSNLRHKLGLNQQEFWSVVGVTQSGGSRYESGRSMPKPVRELVRLVHIEGIDLAHVRRDDFEVAKHLRTKNVTLYRRLLQESRKSTAR